MQQLACNRKLWLLEEFSRRQGKNPAYSLRAFARSLGVSCATLSKILSGKRCVSLKIAESIATRAHFSPDERRNFFAGLTSPTENKKNAATVERQQLEVETFALIADWYHYAILSLAKIKQNSASEEWVAARLGISKREAKAGLERLERLGLIRIANNKIQRTSKTLTTTTNVPSTAIRKYHTQNFQLAKQSMEDDPIALRYLTAVTCAIDPTRINELVENVKGLLDATSKQSDGHEPTEVYTLAVQLFPISKQIKGKK